MANPVSHLNVINTALAMLAGGKIMAEDEDTDLAAQVVPLYHARLAAWLGMHPWSFAGKLFRLDAVPKTVNRQYDASLQKYDNGWRHAFWLPGDRLGDARRFLADPRLHDVPLREFFVEQDIVYADREPLWGSFTVVAAPQVWKPDFMLAMQTIAASDFCVPVCHDKDLAETLRVKAEGSPQEQGRGGLIGRAMAADAVGARAKAPLWSDPLTAARMG